MEDQIIFLSDSLFRLLVYLACLWRPQADKYIRDINAWILDYLTTKGFPKSAARFAEEANLPQHCARESAQARYDIMDRINAGDVQAAIELLNDYAPQVCALSPSYLAHASIASAPSYD